MEENKKINIEVKKINNKNNEIEWTKTLEIVKENVNEIPEEEKNEIVKKYSLNNKNSDKNSTKQNYTTVLVDMSSNPFHQPHMNTIEFKNQNEDTIILANIISPNNQINAHTEMMVIEKLLEDKIITKEEFSKKKQLILGKK